MAKYKVDISELKKLKTIDNFNTSYNVTLSTYACPITLSWSKISRNLLKYVDI